MTSPPKNDIPDKALVEEIERLEETLGALEGHHGDGGIRITMTERRLFAKLLRDHIQLLSQPQHGGLVEALRDRAQVACDAECNGDRGDHDAGCLRATAILNTLSNSPVVGEDARVQTNPPQVPPFLSAPTFDDHSEDRVCINGCLYLRADYAAKRFSKPTPTDTADRREAVARAVYEAWGCCADAGSAGQYVADAIASLAGQPEGWQLIGALGDEHEGERILVRDDNGDVYAASFGIDLDGGRIWSAYCGQYVTVSPQPVEWWPAASAMIAACLGAGA